jgi:SpoVK/Ycf46/Vps4 family AAA+-type ATPase
MADVGGLDELKLWLDRRGQAFSTGARRFGLDAPKGVLLLGIQGCGKSLTAKAIAATWQFPLLRFDMGKVFGGIVGQSEGNIRTALQVAQALAPCVLWIDEIEKGMAGMGSSGQTDGGTTARVVGTLLTWMQEKREPVFVVATANRIDMLPPELLRKGRFDEIFFVDLPTREIRKEILGIHLRKKDRNPDDFDLDALATASVGFSGAELEEAVREGLYEAFAHARGLTTEDIASALVKTFPLSQTMREEIDDLRKWAQVRARLASSVVPEGLPDDKKSVSVPRLRQEATRNPFIPGKK